MIEPGSVELPAASLGSRASRISLGFVLLVAVLTCVLYGATLHPGVSSGDSAELQYCAPLLGILHSPGYPLVVLPAALFSTFPGADVAFRVNLMTLVAGVAGVLLLYATLRRMTGCTPAALVASLTFAFSSVPWSHAIRAEVYTVCNALLLAATYCFARFVGEARTRWLYAAALLLGACLSQRIAEVFVAPAFLLAWWFVRRSAPIRVKQAALCLVIGAAPFAFTLIYYDQRESPAMLHARDDALRDAAVDGPAMFHELTGTARLMEAVRYTLGLVWQTRKPVESDRSTWGWQVDKYAWHLSGAGALRDRFSESDREQWARRIEQGRGTSIGLPGVLLAAAALYLGRRQPAWLTLGAGFFIGNCGFFLYHRAPDNLEFIMPGLAGLAMLIGVAVANFRGSMASGRRLAALALPVALAFSNFPCVNQNTATEKAAVSERMALADAPWPENCVVIAPYNRAMTIRYVLHIAAKRTDVRVISMPGFYTRSQRDRLLEFALNQSQPIFLAAELMDRGAFDRSVATTDAAILRLGFARLTR